MKKVKMLTAGSLLLTMVLGASGAAMAEKAETAEAKTAAKQALLAEKPVMIYHHAGGLLLNQVHERKYMQLLIQAYSPESATEWNAALEERKLVESEMSKTLPKDFILKESVSFADGKEAELKIAPPFKEGVTNSNRRDFKEDVLSLNPSKPGAGDAIIKKEMEEQSKLQDDFAKAVEAGDASAIKALLPKLLDNYKKQTADMKVMAEKMKQAEKLPDNNEGK